MRRLSLLLETFSCGPTDNKLIKIMTKCEDSLIIRPKDKFEKHIPISDDDNDNTKQDLNLQEYDEMDKGYS